MQRFNTITRRTRNYTHTHENITDFYKRLEKLKNECITAEHSISDNTNDLPSLKKAIQRTSLRRFILHCKPEISQMLRARNIATLNEAFSMALQEEKILNYTKFQRPRQTFQYCNFRKSTTHHTSNCRRKQQSFRQSPSQSQNHSYPLHTHSTYDPSKFCAYCKNKGHHISECRKRHYRQQFQQQQQQAQQPHQQNNSNPRINHLNEESPLEMNALSEDTQIQEAFNTT